jgi:hypothetical protein
MLMFLLSVMAGHKTGRKYIKISCTALSCIEIPYSRLIPQALKYCYVCTQRPRSQIVTTLLSHLLNLVPKLTMLPLNSSLLHLLLARTWSFRPTGLFDLGLVHISTIYCCQDHRHAAVVLFALKVFRASIHVCLG